MQRHAKRDPLQGTCLSTEHNLSKILTVDIITAAVKKFGNSIYQ